MPKAESEKPLSIPDQAREDRIDSIADAIVEAAMTEALMMMIGPKSILEAMTRARTVIEEMAKMPSDGAVGARRMNELRVWLGMVSIPDAAATRDLVHAK